MEDLLRSAAENQAKAWEVIRDNGIIAAWESAGAEINLVGSLKTGLLMKHRDIDFHIYSNPLRLADSFRAVETIAERPGVRRVEFVNLAATEEACFEWHVQISDREGVLWTVDMIHIQRGSRYDGWFEKVAERICECMTPEQKLTILRLKNETPESDTVMGIEYCQAVIRDGVRSFAEFAAWRKANPANGIVPWMP
ncbi:MAG: hypothetical protein V8T90_02220 [Victivallales bacterium]|jgi:hypothetical protein